MTFHRKACSKCNRGGPFFLEERVTICSYIKKGIKKCKFEKAFQKGEPEGTTVAANILGTTFMRVWVINEFVTDNVMDIMDDSV